MGREDGIKMVSGERRKGGRGRGASEGREGGYFGGCAPLGSGPGVAPSNFGTEVRLLTSGASCIRS